MRKELLLRDDSSQVDGWRVDSGVNKILGPVTETPLLPGEKVAVRTRRVLSRKGRCVVRARVFGEASLGWLDALRLWGASVEVFVTKGGSVKHLVDKLYPDVFTTPHAEALKMPPHRWDGLMVGTVETEADANAAKQLVRAWHPSFVIMSCHHTISRPKARRWMDLADLGYQHTTQHRCSHQDFGGVTLSDWKIAFSCRSSDLLLDFSIPRMTAGLYARHLQTALDDTLGPDPSRRQLDSGKESVRRIRGVIGVVDGRGLLMDGSEVGVDLMALTNQEMRELWVRAVSVFSKKKVLRRMTLLELLAVWDYAGKIHYKGMSNETLWNLLFARIRSPPAKILTTVTFRVCQQRMEMLVPFDMPDLVSIEGQLKKSKQRGGVLELKGIQRAKAAVPDDAGVDLKYWALPNETKAQTDARTLLRRFAHMWWVYNLSREAYEWLRQNGNHLEDRLAIEDCIARAAGSDYWDWHRGSRLFFWRFPEEGGWRKDARDGVEFWHLTEPPTGLHFRNIPASSREAELQIRTKVFQLCFRWYLEHGNPDLVTPRFSVEKVADEAGNVLDIRAVWDAKRNGLNATLWSPRFSNPTTQDAEDLAVKWLDVPVGEYLRRGSPPQDYTQEQDLFLKSFSWDHDVAQQFNNFRMHKKERHSHGVRFIHTRNDGSPEPETILQCCVLNFGCLCSPYVAVQGEERIMELCEGDPSDTSNPFQYHECWLNLPTSREYDPSLPRVLLLRADGELANRKVTFVDDIHGGSRGRLASDASVKEPPRVLAMKMNHKGNQCAGRKFGPPTLSPRPWNGAMIHTDSPHPVKGTTAKKWNRGRSGLAWVWRESELPEDCDDPIGYIDSLGHWEAFLDTAELRRIAGLWIHLTELYTEGRCFLKGFFNAIEAFRPDRDADGWRMEISQDEAYELELFDGTRAEAGGEYPALTRVTYQLVLHVHALRRLFDTDEPRVSPIRPQEKNMVRYACGDASAEGFGQAMQYPELIVDERDGLWLPEISEKSSNLREALNIANHLEQDIRMGLHDGCEIWQATDNAVWCAVCNKGMSSVRHLFDLLVKIKVLCYEHEVFYHCFHISGDRMIATGVDGLSRGDKEAGITLGFDLRDFLPLDTSAFDYPGNELEEWCKSWMGEDYSPPAKPIDWFRKAQMPGVHVMAPPPAAALIALKEVARARHKRPREVTYVILIPRLLYQEEWRSRFQKEVDVWFNLSTGKYWPHSAYEPLLVGISFPLYRTRPWLLRMERDKVVELGRTLSTLSKTGDVRLGDHLRELWRDPRAFIAKV